MTVGTPLPLTSLPPEILLLISEHMDAHDLVHLSRVCRSLAHLGGLKVLTKALMREYIAEPLIDAMRTTISRLDVVVELFRYVDDRKASYPDVAFAAARLGDLKQLESWRAEFGFIPPEAYSGASASGQIAAFDHVHQHVKFNGETAYDACLLIGSHGQRALFDHLKSHHPDEMTPGVLETIAISAAKNQRLEFALDVFDCLPPRGGFHVFCSAMEIAKTAARVGNTDVFSEFIDMYPYPEFFRTEIYVAAAQNNRVDFMQEQEQSDHNASDSPGKALIATVDTNAFEAFQHLLDFEVHRRSGHYIESDEYITAFMAAVTQQRSEMVPLLMPHVLHTELLRGAAASQSYDEAVMLIRRYQSAQRQYCFHTPSVNIGNYSDDWPDWKMKISLVIDAISSCIISSRCCEVEMERYKAALTGAIDLARELGISDLRIRRMSQDFK
jgi:hypothetical protein